MRLPRIAGSSRNTPIFLEKPALVRQATAYHPNAGHCQRTRAGFHEGYANDDFNAILELKMRGYQPSENVLKSLQPDISATNFIAAAKIFQMEGMLKSLQDIKPVQSPIIGGNKRSMELGD